MLDNIVTLCCNVLCETLQVKSFSLLVYFKYRLVGGGQIKASGHDRKP